MAWWVPRSDRLFDGKLFVQLWVEGVYSWSHIDGFDVGKWFGKTNLAEMVVLKRMKILLKIKCTQECTTPMVVE